MYLLTMVYNAESSLPNFLSGEIRNMLVPDCKELWEARDRRQWERAYDRYSALWAEDGMLMISELWRSEETGSKKRRERVERWVREVDEFGMLLFGVCVHIHGC